MLHRSRCLKSTSFCSTAQHVSVVPQGPPWFLNPIAISGGNIWYDGYKISHYLSLSLWIHKWIDTPIKVCIYIYMYKYTCIHIYIYIYARKYPLLCVPCPSLFKREIHWVLPRLYGFVWATPTVKGSNCVKVFIYTNKQTNSYPFWWLNSSSGSWFHAFCCYTKYIVGYMSHDISMILGFVLKGKQPLFHYRVVKAAISAEYHFRLVM